MPKISSLCIVLFVVFLDWVGLGLVYPIFSTMLFNSDYAIVDPATTESVRGWYLGILIAAMSISQLFSSPILGSLSDQKGRRPLYLFSILLGFLGYVLCIFAILVKNMPLLIVSRCLVGFSAGNAAVVTATIVDLSTTENKAKYFGLYGMACGVGFTVGPFLGGFLAKSSFSLPFYVAGSAAMLSFILIFFFFKETHHIRKLSSIGWNESVRNLKKAFKVQELKILFLMLFLFCFGWSFLYEFISVTWITKFSLDSEKIGFFYAYSAVIYALSSGVLIRPIIGRYKNHAVLFYALLSVGIILISSIMFLSSFWIWIYLPVVTFLIALIFPTSMALISNKATKDSQGEILGVLQAVQSSAFAISPLAAGFLLGDGSYTPMLVGGLSTLAAAILLGGFLKKEIFVK